MKKKIKFLCSLINKGALLVIDVGCDHGYLSIELLTNQRCKYVLNIDNKIEPLQNAINNLQKYNLQLHVINLLNDGLVNLPLSLNPDAVVIAGIGGYQIIRILSQNKLNGNIKYILQPESDAPKLRTWLFKNHYQITNEHLIKDYERFYLIIEIQKKLFKQEFPLSFEDIEIGPILKNRINDPVVKEYYENQLSRLELIPSNKRTDVKIKKIEMISKLLNNVDFSFYDKK